VVTSLLSLPAALLALTACGTGTAGDVTAASAGSATGSTASSTSGATDESGSTDAPAFPATTDPDTQDPSSDSAVTVRDIRLGHQDGFDRVVFEFGGTGMPGWDVQYVDAASSQGSGQPVHVTGDAILRVSLTGVGYPYATGVTEYSARTPLTADGTHAVTEVAYDATFEGTATAFVGATASTPFRVYALQNPTRVVLEVSDRS
jgi:hypothetical protein